MAWLIIDNLLNAFKSVVLYFVNLLPDAGNIGYPDWSPYLAHANMFVNMPLLFSLISMFVAYQAAILVVRLVLWIWSVIKP